jgi:hypothetical protein
LKSEWLSAKSKLTFYKAFIRPKSLCLPSLGVCGGQPCFETARPAKYSPPHHWKFTKAHTGPRFTPGVPNPLHLWLCNKHMQEGGRSHTKSRQWEYSKYR